MPALIFLLLLSKNYWNALIESIKLAQYPVFYGIVAFVVAAGSTTRCHGIECQEREIANLHTKAHRFIWGMFVLFWWVFVVVAAVVVLCLPPDRVL